MNKRISDVLNDLAKIMIAENPSITPEDVEEFIATKTYFEVLIDYNLTAEDLLAQCKFSQSVFKSNSDAIAPGFNTFIHGTSKVKMKLVPEIKLEDHMKYNQADGFQLLSYFKQYKKNNIIAIGKGDVINGQLYYPAISKSGDLIEVNAKNIYTSGFYFLVILV